MNTPTREAIVQVTHDNGTTWTTAPEVDPIDLPVTDNLVDVFHPGLIGLMDGICAWEAIDSSANYRLVWSGTNGGIKGLCPVCDDVFPVSEGLPGDEANEGVEAVCCGCDPRDSFNG